MRKFGWIISSLLLLAGMGIPGALPVSAQANPSAFTVSGRLTGRSGPVRVVLYRWPAQVVTAALKPGQTVPLRKLASQTKASGSYALKVGKTARQICGLDGPPGGDNPAPRLIVAGAK
jgi:hypothetical protein